MPKQGEQSGFTARLRAAFESDNRAMLLELTRALALTMTHGDHEAADAAFDAITDRLMIGDNVVNYPAWARYVIRATASKVWKARKRVEARIDEEISGDSLGAELATLRKGYVKPKDRLALRILQMRTKGRTHKQIAKALHITENASMLRLSKLRKRLKSIS